MSPEEYLNLERVEREHWYYVGKRKIVKYWVQHTVGTNSALTMLDCGAGSGAFAVEMSRVFDAYALDDHNESLEILKSRLPADRIINGSCTSIPIMDSFFDVVTALDVLEHVADDQNAVTEMFRVLKPGGWLIATVPAMMSLWSDWDVSLQHQRRYSKAEILALFSHADITINHCAYINILAMPVVWLVRSLRKLDVYRSKRIEDHVPRSFINKILQTVFVYPAYSRIQFPFGVGLIIVARKHSIF